MKAVELMRKNVVCVAPQSSVREVARLLTEHHVGVVPVVDAQRKVLGVVTEGDLLHRTEIGTEHPRRGRLSELFMSTRKLAREYVKENGIKAEDVMSRPAICVEASDDVADVVRVLEHRRIKRVPVITENRLVGLITYTNFVQLLASVSGGGLSDAPADAVLREQAFAALQGRLWSPPRANVIVQDGVVHVWGIIASEDERHAIRVSVERLQGMSRFEDHLSYLVETPAPWYGL